MNKHLLVNPPPIMYSGKFPAIQLGVVQAMIFIQGFSTVSLPLIFVVLLKTLRPSHKVTRRSTISLSKGFSRLPSSLDSIVISAAVIQSWPFTWKASWDSLKLFTRLCHVQTSGPNFTPEIWRRRFIPTLAVVDFDTMPGGATRMMKKLGHQWK